MRLILVRHGETEENVAKITQGHMPSKLTKQGIEQAKKLALRLKDEKIDKIFVSDLKRCRYGSRNHQIPPKSRGHLRTGSKGTELRHI